jgi:predicted DNA-binding ribbon-helix-helix protein
VREEDRLIIIVSVAIAVISAARFTVAFFCIKKRPHDMPKDELIIQLLKIGLGLGFAVYFIWWSLAVLHRLPPPH